MAEGTQKQAEEIVKQNEALIAEMVRDALKAPEPGTLKPQDVIHKGDGTLPAPMVAQQVSSAGYVYVWDTRTFEKIPVLYYMLAQKLRQRRPDGSYRFTTKDPGQKPKQGTHKCMLHADNPNREHYNELGLAVCRKENLLNPHQVRMHMIRKHKQEWETVETERKEKERLEEFDLRKLLLRSALGKSAVEQTTTVAKEEPTGADLNICPKCKMPFKYLKAYKKHIKDCK